MDRVGIDGLIFPIHLVGQPVEVIPMGVGDDQMADRFRRDTRCLQLFFQRRRRCIAGNRCRAAGIVVVGRCVDEQYAFWSADAKGLADHWLQSRQFRIVGFVCRVHLIPVGQVRQHFAGIQ